MSAKNRVKLTPFALVCTSSTHLSPCPCRHTINFKKSEVFCPKKCGRPHLKYPLVRKMSALDKSLLSADVFLWTALYQCHTCTTHSWAIQVAISYITGGSLSAIFKTILLQSHQYLSLLVNIRSPIRSKHEHWVPIFSTMEPPIHSFLQSNGIS